jgi:magnesium chelatase family protein
MVGGGSRSASIGEVTLAHRGVLFLDELPEFRPSVLDALRQPLEQHEVVMRRARWLVRFPARMHLLAAMNLCRCGRFGLTEGEPCSCSLTSVLAYQSRVSGAILDRFHLHVPMIVPSEGITTSAPCEPSATVRERVAIARERQRLRWGDHTNASVGIRRLRSVPIDPAANDLLDDAGAAGVMSARAQTATLRIALTLADLGGRDVIAEQDVLEAIRLAPRAKAVYA